jgi:hypothetical protein
MLLSQELKRVPEPHRWGVIHSSTKYTPVDSVFDFEKGYTFFFSDCSWAKYHGWGWTFCDDMKRLVHLSSPHPFCKRPGCALKSRVTGES